MSNILITGATGFIGENVANSLQNANHSIHVVVRASSCTDYLNPQIAIFRSDMSIEQLSAYMTDNKIDMVIHIASKCLVDHNSNDVDILLESNICFGTNLLEAMKISGVTRFLNTSSTWQHFDAASANYVPTNLYAATKEAFSSIIDYYAQVCGMSAITLYIYDSYGSNDRRGKLVSLLDNLAHQQTELNMSGGEQEIGLTHILDIVDAYSQAITELDMNTGHNKYTIEPTDIYSLKEVISIFEHTTGSKLSINWGAREYRVREVMKAWTKGRKLPNWRAKISLNQGFRTLFSTK